MLAIHTLILLFSIYTELKIYRRSKTTKSEEYLTGSRLTSQYPAREIYQAQKERGVEKEASFMEQEEEVTSALCRPRDASPT